MLEIIAIVVVTALILMLGVAATLCFMVSRFPPALFLVILSVMLIRQGAGFLTIQLGLVLENSLTWQLLGGPLGFIAFCFLLLCAGSWSLWDFFTNLGGPRPELEHVQRQRSQRRINPPES